MKLEDAKEGMTVLYTPRAHRPRQLAAPREEGVVTSVGTAYVFVRFGADKGSKACHPLDLELP